MASKFQAGMRDIVATTSSICTVDGEAGKLRFRGYDATDLAAKASYEEVTALLWDGELPNGAALRRLTEALAAERAAPQPVLDAMTHYPPRIHPIEALRAALSVHAMHDPDTRNNAAEANRRKSLRLTAQFASLVAAWARIRDGQAIVSPARSGAHAENFLHMLHDKAPDAESAAAMDAILILHAEHEMNASTFVGRVVVGTFADMHSAVIAALCALKGPRHGGANEDVLAMLEEIGRPEGAEPYIRARLEARAKMTREERGDPRNRIPGWGHAVYRVHDPRAPRLRMLGRRAAERSGTVVYADIADEVYRVMTAETDLPVNVDFFSAVAYKALGIPIDLCTSIFAVARIAGWSAHIMEQFADNRLIRPRADYIGPAPRAFVPMEARR
jgi:2-methylcitrate synthase